jgi:hypothetical protein
MQQVKWVKSTQNVWLPLRRVDLSDVSTGGCYMIWHPSGTYTNGNAYAARVVRVGQGDIADRVGCHRSDGDVLSYERYGTLYVTWAAVLVFQRDGVERYLAETWKPLVGDRFPDVTPIPVNSPWG